MQLRVQRAFYRTVSIEECIMRRRKHVMLDSLPDYLDLICEKPQVVDRGQPQSQDFARTKQMMEIGRAEMGAGVAVASWVKRLMDVGKPDRKSTRLNSSHLVISY